MQLSSDDERRLGALYRATGIEKRYSVLSDYGKTEGFEFYKNSGTLEPFPTTHQRMDVFRGEAVGLSVEAVKNCLYNNPVSVSEITHLIVVSCTGMYAPGLDIDLVKELGLRSSIKRTAINFMGCYAAFNAIKVADSFCNTGDDVKALVVCTELCSLHFQKENTEDNWLANALFADGSAALLVESTSQCKIKLRPISFYCDLATHAEKDMTWGIGDFGFEMKLSTYVPEVIRKGIRQLKEKLFLNVSENHSEVSFFAIHPGGKKILEVIQTELDLSIDMTKYSYEILRRYGNMSSPTVLFVLGEIIKDLHKEDSGRNILSFAFGPGLTLESMLLKIQID
jgi:prepilin-type processing-associated H-X9-DG protein